MAAIEAATATTTDPGDPVDADVMAAPVPGPVRPRRDQGVGTVPDPGLLPPAGIVLGVGMVLWGIERFLDEHLWLGEDGHLGSLLVQGAGIALAVAGVVLLATRLGPLQRWRRGEAGGAGGLPSRSPPTAGRTGPGGVEDTEAGAMATPADEVHPPAPVPSVVPSGPSPDGD